MVARGRAHPSFGMTPTFQNFTQLTSYLLVSHIQMCIDANIDNHSIYRLGDNDQIHHSLNPQQEVVVVKVDMVSLVMLSM